MLSRRLFSIVAVNLVVASLNTVDAGIIHSLRQMWPPESTWRQFGDSSAANWARFGGGATNSGRFTVDRLSKARDPVASASTSHRSTSSDISTYDRDSSSGLTSFGPIGGNSAAHRTEQFAFDSAFRGFRGFGFGRTRFSHANGRELQADDATASSGSTESSNNDRANRGKTGSGAVAASGSPQTIVVAPSISAVPEPSTFMSAGMGGLSGLGYTWWRRKRMRSALA